MTNEERLAAAEAKAAELQAEIAQVRAELAAEEEKAWESWKPEVAQAYWLINTDGVVLDSWWDDDRTDNMRRDFNNCFPTKEAAERHALRLRSMRPTCPVPKKGDGYWIAIADGNRLYAEAWRWDGCASDVFAYNQGIAFTTKEACNAWIAEFGDAWITLEDEAK